LLTVILQNSSDETNAFHFNAIIARGVGDLADVEFLLLPPDREVLLLLPPEATEPLLEDDFLIEGTNCTTCGVSKPVDVVYIFSELIRFPRNIEVEDCL
jgi:hypothetical protein